MQPGPPVNDIAELRSAIRRVLNSTVNDPEPWSAKDQLDCVVVAWALVYVIEIFAIMP